MRLEDGTEVRLKSDMSEKQALAAMFGIAALVSVCSGVVATIAQQDAKKAEIADAGITHMMEVLPEAPHQAI